MQKTNQTIEPTASELLGLNEFINDLDGGYNDTTLEQYANEIARLENKIINDKNYYG